MMDMFPKKGSSEDAPKEDKRRVWTSETADAAIKAIQAGYKVANPFYQGKDLKWREGNLVFQYTELEREEIKRCAADIVYFVNTYCYVMTDDGYQRIELRDYQKDVLRKFQDNRFNIFLSARQTGKSITVSLFLTWYLLFNFDKNVMLSTNKGDTTKEVLNKIRGIMELLPFFLKPGIVKKDVFSMAFDNGCTIMGTTTTPRSGIGFTIHLLFLDEFAHVPEHIKEPFYTNIYPTVSASKTSKIIITSTPNGHDLFKRLYDDAIAEPARNTYVPSKVDWWQVPGRDDEWKKETVANLGSEEAFNIQFGCQFLSSDSTLFGAEEFKLLEKSAKDYVMRDFPALDDLGLDYSYLRWDPAFDEADLRNGTQFVVSVDLAEGVGRDYSVVSLFKVELMPPDKRAKVVSPGSLAEFYSMRQVAVFRHNGYSVDDVAKIIYTLLTGVVEQENVKMVVEANTYGNELIKALVMLYPNVNDFDESVIVRFKHRTNATGKKPGLRIVAENKKVYCERTRRAVKTHRLVISDRLTVREFEHFSRKRNGTYAAASGNDDLAMTVVNAMAMFDTPDWAEQVSEDFDRLPGEVTEDVEAALDGVERTEDATSPDEWIHDLFMRRDSDAAADGDLPLDDDWRSLF